MIDVARFKLGDSCPRCINRRVYAVDQDRNLWLCIPNAMPVPWRHDQTIEHDAADETMGAEGVNAAMRAIATLSNDVVASPRSQPSERPNQPCEAGRTRRSQSGTSAH